MTVHPTARQRAVAVLQLAVMLLGGGLWLDATAVNGLDGSAFYDTAAEQFAAEAAG